jgi:glutamine amidotransferase
MQLLFNRSEEGIEPGFGLLPGSVVRFRFDRERGLAVPHMGWNGLNILRPSPLLAGLGDEPRFYFAHSFYAAPEVTEHVIATTTYGQPFASVVAMGNVMGAQFHPEKSHRFGLQLLRNFVEL